METHLYFYIHVSYLLTKVSPTDFPNFKLSWLLEVPLSVRCLGMQAVAGVPSCNRVLRQN